MDMAVAKRTWTTSSGETRTAWVVRYYDADGIYRTKTFKRERDAKTWEAQAKVDLKKGVHRPDSDSITVSEAGALWLERCQGEELETWTTRMYESHLRLHIEPATVPKGVPNGWNGKLGDVKLSQLTSPLCEAFRDQLLKANWRNTDGEIIVGKIISRKMARKILGSFKAILRDSQRRGLIAYNPAQPVRIDTKTREQAPIRIGEQIPSKADIRTILAASTDPWHPLFLTAAFTGMRASELRGLIWANVDLDGCVIHVRQRADEKCKIGPCKTKSAYREIQISDAVANELRRWRPLCPESSLGLVFPNGRGNLYSHGNIGSHGWYPVQHGIKMERPNGQAKYGFHSMRHFYASIMIEQGTPPKRLQSLLGHATLAETMDTYGHLFPAGVEEITRINNAVVAVLTPGPEELSLRDVPLAPAAQDSTLVEAANRIETVELSDGERDLAGRDATAHPLSSTPLPTDTSVTKQAFYECEVCGFFHPEGRDCAVETRFDLDDLDEEYGDGGWMEVDPPSPHPNRDQMTVHPIP
jgi:integrase